MLKNKTNLETLSANLNKTNRKDLHPPQHLLTLYVKNTNEHTSKLTLKIIQMLLFEIWQSINKTKYDKIHLPQNAIINKLNAQLQTILQTHYKKHKLDDTLNQFQ